MAERRRLSPPKAKRSLLAILSLAGMIAGLLAARSGEPIGWLFVVSLGFGLVAIISLLLPGASWLELDDGGFTVRSLYRTYRHHWHEVAEFGAVTIEHNRLVAFNLSSDTERSKTARAASRAMIGFDVVLPDTYGLKADALAELMTRYKERATEASVPDSITSTRTSTSTNRQ